MVRERDNPVAICVNATALAELARPGLSHLGLSARLPRAKVVIGFSRSEVPGTSGLEFHEERRFAKRKSPARSSHLTD